MEKQFHFFKEYESEEKNCAETNAAEFLNLSRNFFLIQISKNENENTFPHGDSIGLEYAIIMHN